MTDDSGSHLTDLSGTRAIVTGAARGLGKSIAMVLGRRGAAVAALDVDEDGAKVTAADLVAQGAVAFAYAANVTDHASVTLAMSDFASRVGAVDLLVANAAALSYSRVVDLEPDEWRRVLDINATGVFLSSRGAVRLMLKQGGGGTIVVISSVAGKEGEAGLSHYCASKFAVIGFVQSLAKEVAEFDITVNAVCPGTVMTPMIAQLREQSGDDVRAYVDRQLLRRPQTGEEIAEAVIFLHRARSITGQALNVDGGTIFH